ncbi:unnamed protein product [Anisakis simplex]|uniref:Milton domain-containing protein n=1 Tax=Anisakis simplex TaxID=6269 RepID=A0A0M3JYK7_ANISI|nr:unnamed protein product [Anisakis simplex]
MTLYILRLQSLIAEKNEEVAMQSAEVERLLQEVTARESHEKALKDENLDLHEQLNDALAQHEQMTADFLELQERYTEVMSMLHDTEEELRTFRQNQKSHRAASSDSLYDSLASELEASDSGFYSTMSSARFNILFRSESGGEYGRTDVKRLHIELERIRCKEPNEPLMEAPSVERVAVASETRSVAVSTDHLQQPMLTSATAQTSPDGRLRQPSHCSDDVGSFHRPSFHGINLIANNSHHVWSPRDGMRRLGHRNSTSSSTSGDTLSKTPSSDSLAGYEGPKMGEPGKPGTRDLDFSIRRLNLRKQVEREYARFRRERGLSPLCIPFFPPPIPKKKRASAMLRSQSMQQSNDFLNRVVPKHRPNLLKPWHIFSNVGLLAAIRDTVSQGVLTRSTILHNSPMTPPSTPLIYRRYTNGTAVRLQQRLAPRSATSLVDALGLSVPLQMPIISDRTNTNNNYSAFRTITKLSDLNEANNNNSNTSIKSAPS